MTRRWAIAVSASVAGFIVGGLLMLAAQGAAFLPDRPVHDTPAVRVERAPEHPDTVLAWVPGRMPAGFRRDALGLGQVDHAVVVRSGTAWLTASHDADGTEVDRHRGDLAVPIEVAGVDPGTYRPFIPPADRDALAELARGRVILGETSAELRGVEPGAELRFGPKRVQVAAVWPDEFLGAHEVIASEQTAASLGVTRPRYALIDPKGPASVRTMSRQLESLVTGRIQIRQPGETPYFRQGDAVLPPVALKELFGEFLARPTPGGNLGIDRHWERQHLAARRVPLLGKIRCNEGIFRQLEGALRQIRQEGLGHLIHTSDGCYSPRFINHDPELGISHHTWGTAFDINAAENPFGHSPRSMDDRIIEIFREWGFTWGGSWVVPDGMHFEYQRAPR